MAPRGRGKRRQLTQLEATPEARPALEAWIRAHGTIHEAAASQPGAETLRGRGRVYVVAAPAATGSDGEAVAGAEPERWVIRHYHRGGAIAPVLGDRYLRLGTPRPVREYATGRALERRGIPTPAHLGAAVYPSGIWYRGDLVTRWVPGSRDLAAVLFPGRTLDGGGSSPKPSGVPGAEAEAAMRAAGRLFRRLHEGGVVHPDLNLKNILLAGEAESPDALILDLDGATVSSRIPDTARLRMVARFWRSARKWQRATGVDLPSSLSAAFEAGYTD